MTEREEMDLTALAPGIRDALDVARRDLLDLTARNRLLHTPPPSARTSAIAITDEASEHVYATLVERGQAMSFLPRDEATATDATESAADLAGGLAQPDEEDEYATRQRDRRLQTALDSTALQTKLLRTYHAARTFEEERGVNVLAIALGFLEWRERDDPDKARFAPLILVPVNLERRSATSRFRVRATGADLTTNLSLQAKLRVDFALELPELEEDDELSPNGYFDRVEKVVGELDGWRVHRGDIRLGFFSFTRLLMYRDLEPAQWPSDDALVGHPLVARLLGPGFDDDPVFDDSVRIDDVLEPVDAVHVLDADSSQALAIESARRGQNLVIQGPPGTGKSQTIANLIAAAVRDGQRVLFVAEKAAALDVVKRRLENIGLGDLCLALHSSKTNKRQVLEELGRTLELSRPVVGEAKEQAERLGVVRGRLNEQVAEMHRPGRPSGRSPWELVSDLVELRAHGAGTPDFALPEAPLWTREMYDEKLAALRELVAYVHEVGAPAEHPWRGVMLDSVLPTDVDRLGEQLPVLRDVVDRLRDTARQLEACFVGERATTAGAIDRLAVLGTHLGEAPPFDRMAYADDVWATAAHRLPELIAAGRAVASARRDLESVLIDGAWRDDIETIRRDLAAHGRSWLRFLNGAYRRAQSRFRGLCRAEAPKSLDERLALLDRILDGKAAQRDLEAHAALGAQAFGSGWQGEHSDFATLERLVAWDQMLAERVDDPDAERSVLAAVDRTEDIEALARQAHAALSDARRELGRVVDQLRLDVSVAFDGAATIDDVDLAALAERFDWWQRSLESISQWIAIRIRASRASDEGLDVIVERLDDGRIDPGEAVDCFRMAYGETVLRELLAERHELGDFDGLSFERLRDEFRALDEERLLLTRREVADAHYLAMPRGGAGIGEMGVLRHEINKKRRHLPLRQLFRKAGSAISAIKPVFMMSPLSVAQYLEPGALDFDLLVIDEASQVRPVDALGAIARCKRMVVVGDDRQLPPTSFFRRVLDDEAFEDDDVASAGDLESILGLCAAQNVPSRMLQWHYRSRHHSLIAVSNRAFYHGRLLVVPSPSMGEPGLGLDFVHVGEGIFERGRSGVNRAEAEAVAEAVMEHAAAHPEVSLGVGAFSVRQRDAILDALERLRRRHRHLESFFATDLPEPFFVKNLENIQGDERDVILISVGYGRDPEGKLTMNFGPLSAEGGERRLNVLISRARRRCAVYASIMPEDIDLRRATGLGPSALRTFLAFARDGRLDDEPARTEREPASPFESVIAETIRAAGWEVHAGVGIAGIYLDLAVVDPSDERRYMLGIECDGASYCHAPSARDRDRLRETILEERGWRLHRIWIRDWFLRPEEQRDRLLEAINVAAAGARVVEDADSGDDEDVTGGADDFSATEFDETEIEREAAPPVADDQITGSVPYREAEFTVPRDVDLGDLAPSKLERVIERVVRIEGPVHRDEVAQRVRALWGLSRTGARITRLVHGSIDAAATKGKVTVRDGFVSIPGVEIRIRSRADVASTTLRNLSMLPPEEVETCLLQLIDAHVGVSRDQLVTAAARLLGFRSTSRHLRNHLLRRLDGLLTRGAAREDHERLYLPE